MPYSATTFDYYVTTLMDLLRPARACDIGPGAGKYGRIMKAAATTLGYACDLTAVEIDAGYVDNSPSALSMTR